MASLSRARAAAADLASAAARSSEAVWQEVEYADYTADLALWRELVEASSPSEGPCRVLDLGCGIGRVSLPLAELGSNVTAVDVEAELVAALEERSRAAGLEVRAEVGDARSLALDERFDLVLAPMQLLQLFGIRRERRAALRTIARHLRPGGRAGIALLDPADLPLADHEEPLLPDLRERGGWIHSSRPVAGRLARNRGALELERQREVVSPAGALTRSLSRVRLTLVSPAELERDARAFDLVTERRRHVPATADHIGSVVTVLRAR